MVQDSGFRVQGSGLRAQGSGLNAKALRSSKVIGLRIQGIVFTI